MRSEDDAGRVPAEAGEVRREARAWIKEHLDPAMRLADWLEVLADSGWAAPSWPRRWHGKGLPPALAAAAQEELAAAGAPGPPAGLGIMLAGPTIIDHGTEEQKRRFLRPLLTGEHAWCQLFSEPGAGSDLASLATRARRDGEEFIVDGQKVWTSLAQVADYGMLLARTDPSAPKHHGISYFALGMGQPGVEVRPLRQMTGDSLFNEVFLSGARVAAGDLIGELNGGWAVARTTLAHERTSLGARVGGRRPFPSPAGSRLAGQREVTVAEFMARCRQRSPGRTSNADTSMVAAGAGPLIRLAADLGRDADPLVRQELARLHTICQINAWNGLRGRAAAEAGGPPGPEASLGKLMASQIARLWRETATLVCGPAAMLAGPDGPLDGQVALQALAAPGPAIYGGSDQIQRNVIGERVLGLPKEPDPSVGLPWRQLRAGPAGRGPAGGGREGGRS